MTTNFDAILAQLHNVRANGKGFTAQCPAHDDKRNSLSVSRGDDGKILLHCFAGCKPETIASALGFQMRELFSQNGHTRAQITATYDYTDERGALLYQCVRYAPKDFRQRRPDGAGGWQWNLNGTRRVLYRLPELIANPDKPVFIVEGEKDADNLARLGLLATTNVGGANNWRDEYAESLRGRHVVIVPDNDDVGRKHARRVAQSAQQVAASVKILELPNLPAKGDVSDWLNAGGNRDTLLELAARTPTYADASEPTANYLPYSDILEAFHRAETGDAEILARLFADKIAYDHAENAWHLFRKHFWERDVTGRVEKFVTDELAAQYLFAAAETKRRDGEGETVEKRIKELYVRANALRNRNKIANVLDRARKQDALALRGDEWDRDPMLLGVANGVLNLRYRDFEFRDGAPRDYVRTIAPTQWENLHEPAPRWEQFLQEIFAGDAEIIAFIQRWFGYCLTADVSENAFVVLHGEDGRNGKRILTETIARVMGGYATAGEDDLFLDAKDARAGAPKQFLVDLAARRLVLLSETREGARFNLARIKQLAGGDTIRARGVYAPRGAEIAPTWKFVLSTNRLPHADADDAAFYERIFIVKLTQRFVTHPDPTNPNEHPRDAKLDQTLRAEQSGILAWLVRGCLDWQRDGLNPPESVRMATEEYRAGEDTLAQWQAERCFVGANMEMKAGKGYEDYSKWADENGLKPMNGMTFAKRMGKRFEKKRTERGYVYLGIGLLNL
jgi:putative DNA primase/helicase